MQYRTFLLPALVVLLPIIVVAAYMPGLHGPFLFDDFANLPILGSNGPIHSGDAFWRYITSGNADPTGRPVALLSFLIDAQDWPASPYPFKRTNLAIHVVNSLLLVWLLNTLGRLTYRNTVQGTQARRIAIAAVLGATLWAIHPLLVSTTLYIVQREAMLSTLFALAGLIAWLHGRTLIKNGDLRSGAFWIVMGLGGGTVLGTLSKANGVLLPPLALLIEWILPWQGELWRGKHTRPYCLLMAIFAALPTMGVVGYLGYEGWLGLTVGISSVRPWTLAQRLLTEPRVLMDYLGLLWLPRPFTAGVFNDQIQASSSLLSPPTTLVSLLILGMLAACAISLRKRQPALALTVLFYLVGQSLESSTIALELYFEHRNYLPAALMFWPLALWLCGVRQSQPHLPSNEIGEAIPVSPYDRARAILAIVLVTCLACMTYAAADLWGDAKDQALLWAKLNPSSPRAQANAAQAEMNAGHPDLAVKRLTTALIAHPDDIQITLNLLAAQCQNGQIEPTAFEAAERSLGRTHDSSSLLAGWFDRALAQLNQPTCPQMDLSHIERLVWAAKSNPNLADQPGKRQDLYSIEGQIGLSKQTPDEALAKFNLALDQQVRATTAFQQAALLGSAGYPRLGLAHLNHYESKRSDEYRPHGGMPAVHRWVLESQHYWDNELIRLRTTLREDAERQAQTDA